MDETVLDFVRSGMSSAKPRFNINGLMVDGPDCAVFEVAPEVRGMAEAKSSDRVYRYDIVGIDHPDARLIAAAPRLLEALIGLLDTVSRGDEYRIADRYNAARTAIAGARGES